MQELLISDLSLALGNSSQFATHGLSLSCDAGKTYALIGESGCGKSLTALAIMQLLPDFIKRKKGKIEFLTQEVTQLSEAQLRHIRGNQVAMIFQEPMTALNPVMTVAEQLLEVITAYTKLDKASALARAHELLVEVGLSEPQARLAQYPHQLSGGMKQRVMIAMALASEPKLLLADEPTTALDVTIQLNILRLLQSLQKKHNLSILFITHDLGVARQVADEILVMYNGHLVETAPVEQFFKKPYHPYSQLLLKTHPHGVGRYEALTTIDGLVEPFSESQPGCRFVRRCPVANSLCMSEAPDIATVEPNHNVRCLLYKSQQAEPVLAQKAGTRQRFSPANVTGETALQCDDVHVYFPIRQGLLKRTKGYIKAVDGVSFSLPKGKTLALVGESGCGKSSLAKAIMQLNPLHSGKITLSNKALTKYSRKEYYRHVQMIFQDPFSSFNPKCDVATILSEGLKAQGFYPSKTERNRKLLELLSQVGLPTTCLHKYPHEFSGGQRQRLAIARALALEPSVLVCDEPTSALDVSVQAAIINLLKQLQQDHQLSLLFITHDIGVVSTLADEVAVMYLGKIVEKGNVTNILSAPRHPYTKLLLDSVPHVDTPHQEATRDHQAIDVASPINPPSGCAFHPRCEFASERCHRDAPVLRERDDGEVACWNK